MLVRTILRAFQTTKDDQSNAEVIISGSDMNRVWLTITLRGEKQVDCLVSGYDLARAINALGEGTASVVRTGRAA